MPGAVNVRIAWSRPGGGAAPTITSPAFLVAGTVDTVYPTTTFTATGTAPITWSVTAGTLPAGMAFSSAGVLSGTPTATASGSITFRATNAFGFADRPLTLTVNASGSWAPTTLTATVDGTAATLTQVEAITTRSGTWWVDGLGQFGDSYVYAMRFSGNSAFIRLLVVRRAFTAEAGDGTTLDTRSIALAATLNGTPYSWTAGCVQGSVRVVQNEDPIAPNPDWIREAVTNYKVTAFRRENAYNPATFTPVSPDAWRGAYNPTSLGPNQAGSTPSGNANYVGTTTGSGGDSAASRSFLHDIDAGVIDRALHNEDGAVTSLWPQFVQYTFYSLAQPQAANWSTTNHVTADPFFSISAPDRPYEIGGVAGAVNAAIDTLQPVTNWGRDPSHLENTGYVHWLATEDPVAAIVVQRQLAYIIASYYEYRRPVGGTTYRTFDEQERGVYNSFSALFKNKVITESITTLNGKWLWSSARVNKMIADCIAYLDSVTYSVVDSSTTSDPVAYTQKTIGSYQRPLLGGTQNIFAYGGPFDGQACYATSDFFLCQYGPEPLYLWAKSGNAVGIKMLNKAGLILSNLMQYVGGASAISATNAGAGSSRPIILASATVPYTTVTDWANWFNSINPGAPRTTFNGTYSHSINRTGNTLRLARDAGVTGLDPAIASFDSFKAATNNATLVDSSSFQGNWPKNAMGL